MLKKEGLTSNQAEAMFGATGALRCGEETASGNVVGKRDVLAVSAHAFWNPETCQQVARPEDCTFMTIVDGREISLKIGGILATGFQCPNIPGPEDDWVVLSLKEEVPRKIEPYSVGEISEGERVLAVNGANADFFEKSPNTGKARYAKSFADCVYDQPVNRMLATDCSSSFGSSGSALLNSRRELVAINCSGTENEKDLLNALGKKPFKANSCQYDMLKCASYYVEVKGAFKKALEDAASGTSL